MFLVGTGMLIFGVGIYNMFVGSKTEDQPWPPGQYFKVSATTCTYSFFF